LHLLDFGSEDRLRLRGGIDAGSLVWDENTGSEAVFFSVIDRIVFEITEKIKSNFRQNVRKCRLMKTVTVSFGTTVRQMTEISQEKMTEMSQRKNKQIRSRVSSIEVVAKLFSSVLFFQNVDQRFPNIERDPNLSLVNISRSKPLTACVKHEKK